ncbi:MAG: hypothetical protein KBF88_17855 [Polyangiaceae bacterium]|nr:hypothetical protein [Polyangiaceae bacterium]
MSPPQASKLTPNVVAIVALVASLFGMIFALTSTFDFAAHLDRQIHDLHCSFIPGMSAKATGAEGCKTALFSAYSSLFRTQIWGGIPISLFAVGAFAFFAAFAVYLLVAKDRVPKRAYLFLGTIGFTPLVVSLVMFLISLFELGSFCKVCIGLYLSSIALAVAAYGGIRLAFRSGSSEGVRVGGPLLAPALLTALATMTFVPAWVYASSVPNYDSLVTKCGKLEVKEESHKALLHLPTKNPIKPALLFEDPLCPTCKAVHERLVSDGVFEKLDVTLSFFPLDSECNWMLSDALHPGACFVSRALICSGNKLRANLEWVYSEQEQLRLLSIPDAAGKSDLKKMKERVLTHFGSDVASCVDDKATVQKLNHQLHFASKNKIAVSTPQIFLGDQRLCDEDSDLGLMFALSKLAPEVLR